MCDGNLAPNFLGMSRAVYMYIVLYREATPCPAAGLYYLSPSGKARDKIDILHFYPEWHLIDHKGFLLDIPIIDENLKQTRVRFHIWQFEKFKQTASP